MIETLTPSPDRKTPMVAPSPASDALNQACGSSLTCKAHSSLPKLFNLSQR